MKFRAIHSFLEENPDKWFNKHDIYKGIDFKNELETLQRYLGDMTADGYVKREWGVGGEDFMYYQYKPLKNEEQPFKVEWTEEDEEEWIWNFEEE